MDLQSFSQRSFRLPVKLFGQLIRSAPLLFSPDQWLKERCVLHMYCAFRFFSGRVKGAVSRQSRSFCLILPITRPQSLWNLK